MFGNIFSFSLHLFGILSVPSLLLAIYVYVTQTRRGTSQLGCPRFESSSHKKSIEFVLLCYIPLEEEKKKEQSYSNVWLSHRFLSTNSPQGFQPDADGSSEISHLSGYFSMRGEPPFFHRLLLVSVLILSCNSRQWYFGGFCLWIYYYLHLIFF